MYLYVKKKLVEFISRQSSINILTFVEVSFAFIWYFYFCNAFFEIPPMNYLLDK